jgi:drug/metabolite transporter (DMT)-like permease
LSELPPLVIATGSLIGATLGLALPALWLWPAQMPSLNAWLALLVVGVVSTGIAYILFFRLIANAGPSRALSATYVVPVFAVFYGLIFLGEHVTAWMLICAAVILAGTALSTGLIKFRRQHSSA